jgi:hypothetical protein
MRNKNDAELNNKLEAEMRKKTSVLNQAIGAIYYRSLIV